jgi:hypothetical protein
MNMANIYRVKYVQSRIAPAVHEGVYTKFYTNSQRQRANLSLNVHQKRYSISLTIAEGLVLVVEIQHNIDRYDFLLSHLFPRGWTESLSCDYQFPSELNMHAWVDNPTHPRIAHFVVSFGTGHSYCALNTAIYDVHTLGNPSRTELNASLVINDNFDDGYRTWSVRINDNQPSDFRLMRKFIMTTLTTTTTSQLYGGTSGNKRKLQRKKTGASNWKKTETTYSVFEKKTKKYSTRVLWLNTTTSRYAVRRLGTDGKYHYKYVDP